MSLLGTLFMVSPLIFFFACLIIAIISRIHRRPRELRLRMESRGRQTLIPEYIMSDEYPYLKRYAEETIENMELYGESTAELDLQDEEDG